MRRNQGLLVAALASAVTIASLTAYQLTKGTARTSAATGTALPSAVIDTAKHEIIPRVTEMTIPAGSRLSVRLDHAVTTDGSRPGDRFTGSLAAPVVVQNRTVIPAGARVEGVVRTAAPSGRLKGRAILSLAVDRIESDGKVYAVNTRPYTRTSGGHKKRNWTLIGGGTGVGALVGALAGGGQAAAIGAGAGAAAGLTGAALTGRKQVRLPAESLVTFTVREPVPVRVTPA